MFHLFRGIRRRLLNDRAIGRYLMYSLGEIALVVIGILIALYINDLRDFRNDRRQELAYLEGFRGDLARNIAELDRVIEKSAMVQQSAEGLLDMLVVSQGESRFEAFEDRLETVAGYTVFLGFDGTVEDLLGSGRLGLIRNDSIRIALATWKSELGFMRELESLGKDSFINLSSHMTRQLPLAQMMTQRPAGPDIIIEALTQDGVFTGLLLTHSMSMHSLHEHYSARKPQWQRLEASIAEEIRRLER